jgi:hypothetical protein
MRDVTQGQSDDPRLSVIMLCVMADTPAFTRMLASRYSITPSTWLMAGGTGDEAGVPVLWTMLPTLPDVRVSTCTMTESILGTVPVLLGTVIAMPEGFSNHLSPKSPSPFLQMMFIPDDAVTCRSVLGVPFGVANTPLLITLLYGRFISSAEYVRSLFIASKNPQWTANVWSAMLSLLTN